MLLENKLTHLFYQGSYLLMLHKKMLGRLARRELLLSQGQGVGGRVLPLCASVVAVLAGTLQHCGFLSFLDQVFCDWL